MAWSCPDCRYYSIHVNFVCPSCHLGALYDTRSAEELRSEGYQRVSRLHDHAGNDEATAPAVIRRTFLEDVLALSCAGWLIQTVGGALRWLLLIAALILIFSNAETLLSWLVSLAVPILSAIIPIWLLWACLRGIFRS